MVYHDQRIVFVFERPQEMQRTRLVTNQPTKRGPALSVEEPWEIGRNRGSTILEWNGTFRMYYRVGPVAGGGPFWAFVESEDGVEWTRPRLDLVEFEGSKANNLIEFDGQQPSETCFFVDPTGPDEHRFKVVCHRQYEGGMYLMTSADGIRFKRAEGHLLNLIADNHMSAFYDERVAKYRIYLRGWDLMRPWPPIKGSRMLSLAETDDLFTPLPYDEDASDPWHLAPKFQTEEFEHYGLRKIHRELPAVIRPDEHDPPSAGIYQGAVVHYTPSMYVAFPTLYFRHPGPPDGFVNDGILDIQLAVSRDGVEWDRLDRLPYIRLDLPDGPGTKLLHMLTGFVPSGHLIHQYYHASRFSHGEGRVQGQDAPRRTSVEGDPIVCRVEQRMDGFASLETEYAGGEIVTAPFVLASDQITMNIDTSASGHAHAALIDDDGKEIPGFGISDCDRIQCNDTSHTVTWGSQREVKALRGRTVRLRLTGRAVRLYSMTP